MMMLALKIVFCILLCCPLAYVGVNLFNHIVNDATEKKR
ncbi:hypothetical protein M2140_002128 [Clostridiales Family XIII bacterium PM5-7]